MILFLIGATLDEFAGFSTGDCVASSSIPVVILLRRNDWSPVPQCGQGFGLILASTVRLMVEPSVACSIIIDMMLFPLP